MKRSRQARKTGGFTLIELLVAMILAVLVIAPLLGFMISILQDDRREQAKTTTEQEIKSALDYIAQDMEQAVYIYDVTALNTAHNAPPASSGIKDQIPPNIPANGCNDSTVATCQPIIVFWKRKFLNNKDIINGVNVGNVNNQNDAFVYSLVAYYLITDKQGTNSTWSKAARIGRFEIRDGIRYATGITRLEPDPTITGKTNNVIYGLLPTKGFLSFNLATAGTLNVKMNQWQKLLTENYTDQGGADVQILADYIDQSSKDQNNAQITPTTVCPSSNQLIPQSTSVSGFYVCVNNSDPTKISAQVFIRGNALARIQDNASYNSNNLPFFPTASIQIKGESYLYTK